MPIATPALEKDIVPLMDEQGQQNYALMKQAANKVLEENPGIDTRIYTDYLNGWLGAYGEVYDYSKMLKPEGYAPSRTEVDIKQRTVNNLTASEFNRQYPTNYQRMTDRDEIAQAKKNLRSMELLGAEIEGDSLFERVSQAFYKDKRDIDKLPDGRTEKEGWQWGSMAGIIGGGLIGGLMGNYMAGASGILGSGWMGTLAIVLLGAAGAVFGSKVMGSYFDMASTPQKTPQAEADKPNAKSQALTPERGLEIAKENAIPAASATAETVMGGNPAVAAATRFIDPKEAASSTYKFLFGGSDKKTAPAPQAPDEQKKASEPLPLTDEQKKLGAVAAGMVGGSPVVAFAGAAGSQETRDAVMNAGKDLFKTIGQQARALDKALNQQMLEQNLPNTAPMLSGERFTSPDMLEKFRAQAQTKAAGEPVEVTSPVPTPLDPNKQPTNKTL